MHFYASRFSLSLPWLFFVFVCLFVCLFSRQINQLSPACPRVTLSVFKSSPNPLCFFCGPNLVLGFPPNLLSLFPLLSSFALSPPFLPRPFASINLPPPLPPPLSPITHTHDGTTPETNQLPTGEPRNTNADPGANGGFIVYWQPPAPGSVNGAIAGYVINVTPFGISPTQWLYGNQTA